MISLSMRRAVAVLAFSYLIAFGAEAWSGTLMGEVVGVADGDTITVLDAQRAQHKVRLAGIDAPEKKMPWGQKSKETLSDQVYGRYVVVEWNKIDRYGRVVGKVLVDSRDINLAQVRSGMAWHYKEYENEQSVEDRIRYAQEELDARNVRRGLWKDADPTPPWVWRKQQRSANGH